MHINRQTYSPFSLDAFRKELYKRIVSDSRTLPKTKFDQKWEIHTDLVIVMRSLPLCARMRNRNNAFKLNKYTHCFSTVTGIIKWWQTWK